MIWKYKTIVTPGGSAALRYSIKPLKRPHKPNNTAEGSNTSGTVHAAKKRRRRRKKSYTRQEVFANSPMCCASPGHSFAKRKNYGLVFHAFRLNRVF